MQTTSRRAFGKQLTWALGAIPFASLTAEALQPQKRRTRKKKKKLDGDSPITVGGGGGKRKRKVTRAFGDIAFKHDDYLCGNDGYLNPIRELNGVQVRGTTYPAGKNVRVEVLYTRGATNGKIIINKDGKMGVTFDENHFPYDFQNGKHHADDVVIDKLIINGADITLPETGYLEIKAHTKLKP
jgi:hypothetical protein